MLDYTFIFIFAALTASLLGLVALFVYILQLKRSNKNLIDQIKQCQQVTMQNKLGIDEVRQSAIGMGKAIQQAKVEQTAFITQLEQATHARFEQVADKVNEVAMQDAGSKLYTRAAKMVAKGASIEEIMEECEIPRAEAQLVMSMHAR